MEHKQPSNEFEALVDDEGKLTLPAELGKRFAGAKLHVRLHKQEVNAALREKNVTDVEVERIAGVQFESREQAVTFLLSEGVLKNDASFAQRVRKATKR